MKRRLILVLLCVATVSVVGIATASRKSLERSKTVNTKRHQPHQQKADPPGTIDGAKNPELIPDQAAYSLLFRFISNRQTEKEKRHIQSYIKLTGLKDADIDALLSAANEFHQRVSVLDAEVMQIKDANWPNPSPKVIAQLRLLQQRKEAIVNEIVASLPQRLTAKGLGDIRQHLNNRMKRRLKVFPATASAPGGPGWEHRH